MTPAGTFLQRLLFRQPLCVESLFGDLVANAVHGVEEWRDGAYRRTLRLPGGPGIASLRPAVGYVAATLTLTDPDDLAEAVARCRRLLDLDADPVLIDEALSTDKVLAPLVRQAPGRRVPRTVDGHEVALRAVLGQQVSRAAARTHAGRLTKRLGESIDDPVGGLTHLFPTARAVATSDPDQLGLPHTRRVSLLTLAAALTGGAVNLSPDADRAIARMALASLPGVGPWTVETIAMRALADPDAFPATDLGVRAAARALGLPHDTVGLYTRTEKWQPWRAYAAQHLWAVADQLIDYASSSAR